MALASEPATAGGEASIQGRTFKGFGTTIGTWTSEPRLVDRIDGFMQRWVDVVESACSRFRADSDLSRANAAAGTVVRVSPDLIAALEAATAMAEMTLGLCDPAVGDAVINAGYDRSFERIEAEGPGRRGPRRPGGAWRRVEIDRAASTVMVPEGFRLDLGGSAKGWAVDTALAALVDSVLSEMPEAGLCISAGGDLAVAGRPPRGGWPITVRERLDADAASPETELHLTRGAVATSGATARRWQRGKTAGHHIIDPHAGSPGTSPWRLVTVFSDSCLVADAAATAAWLLGADAVDWLETVGLGARLVDLDGGEAWVGDLGRWLDQATSL